MHRGRDTAVFELHNLETLLLRKGERDFLLFDGIINWKAKSGSRKFVESRRLINFFSIQ